MDEPGGVRIARVFDDSGPNDGARVLVDRLWPRGLSRDAAALDDWCRDVAPSTDLRTWYAHEPARFAEFSARYRVELAEPDRTALVTNLRKLSQRRTLTLLIATKAVELSHAAVLADVIVAESGTRPEG